MIQGPLISVIVPVFNGGATLEKCLLSIIGQQLANREIIIIDGGSTDNTPEIIARYRSWLSHVVAEPDNGVYDAMNKGIRLATGQWLYFLGADDELADAAVLNDIFQNPPGNVLLMYGTIINTDIDHPMVRHIHTSSFSSGLYWRNSLHHQSAFYHRSLFDSFRFSESLHILADYDFNLFLFRKKIPSQFIPRIVARCSARGLSKYFPWKLYQEELRLKRNRLPILIYLVNIPWVLIKYITKNAARQPKTDPHSVRN